MTEQRLLDLSHPIGEATTPWPGSPKMELTHLDRAELSTASERHSNCTRVAINIHFGTHMDAPFHFASSGRTIDQVPLEWTYGMATMMRLQNKGSGTQISRGDLVPWTDSLKRTRKAIVQTGWATRWTKRDFFENYPVITPDAAAFLLECGVHLVGMEMPSVDNAPHDTHMVLLGGECLIVESLRGLEQISTDEFLFSATPLCFQNLDGSPVRAMAILSQ
jgi:arylformamidase